jgi:hypothetical protein
MQHSSRKKQNLATPTHEDACARFAYVLQAFFAGHQSEMAREIGCSQAALSKVCRGIQPPGSRLMKSLTKLPGVDWSWAILGQGDLPTPRQINSAGRLVLPVADGLPRVGADGRLIVRATNFEVIAEADYSLTKFFLNVPNDSPITDDAEAGIRAQDLLLIESDSHAWSRDPRFVEKRPCLVRQESDLCSTCLVRVSLAGAPPSMVRLLWPDGTRESAGVEDERPRHGTKGAYFDPSYGKFRRAIHLDTPKAAQSSAQRKTSKSGRLKTTVPTVRLKYIVGVAVRLIRTL